MPVMHRSNCLTTHTLIHLPILYTSTHLTRLQKTLNKSLTVRLTFGVPSPLSLRQSLTFLWISTYPPSTSNPNLSSPVSTIVSTPSPTQHQPTNYTPSAPQSPLSPRSSPFNTIFSRHSPTLVTLKIFTQLSLFPTRSLRTTITTRYHTSFCPSLPSEPDRRSDFTTLYPSSESDPHSPTPPVTIRATAHSIRSHWRRNPQCVPPSSHTSELEFSSHSKSTGPLLQGSVRIT